MAKHAKTLQRLLARPTPTSITWDEVIGLLKHLGGQTKGSGRVLLVKDEAMKRLSSVGGPRPALVSFSCQKGQKAGGLFRLNHPTREQGGVLHAVDDFFVGRTEGGQGAG